MIDAKTYMQMQDETRLLESLNAELVGALRESTDLVPRISGDDPMAPALADWLRNVRAILAKAEGR